MKEFENKLKESVMSHKEWFERTIEDYRNGKISKKMFEDNCNFVKTRLDDLYTALRILNLENVIDLDTYRNSFECIQNILIEIEKEYNRC